MFENNEIDKFYKAIVIGTPDLEIGQIDMNISASRSAKRGMQLNENGKTAITKYRVINSWNSYSLVELKLITGRMHQIRIHMQAINCPLVCDQLYGDGRAFYLSDIKKNYRRSKDSEEKPLLSRQALHSHRLCFTHPYTMEQLEFNSELPKDMRACVTQLDKNLANH